MKIKKSNIVLIIVSLLYLTHTTVNYFIVRQTTKQVVEKYHDVEK